MEGTTYLEHPALGVSLDSGLMEGITQSVTRPDGGSIRESGSGITDAPRTVMFSMDPKIVNHTYVNDDIDTDLPESPMMNSSDDETHRRTTNGHVLIRRRGRCWILR